MRRRISWLVALTTSTVVVSFVIPLCLLVQSMAEERATASADSEARNVAILVARLHATPVQMAEVIADQDRGSFATSAVLTTDGSVLGDYPQMATDPEVRRAIRRQESFTVTDAQGFRVLIPVEVEEGTAVVRTSVTPTQLHQGVAQAWAAIVVLGLTLMALALLVAFRLGRRVSEPLREVAEVAHRLREGDLDARAQPDGGTEETDELAQALNGLAERTGELLAAERAAVGDLSHRLRTPVTALRLDAEAVDDPELASRLQEHIAALQVTIDAIVTEARRPVRTDLTARCDATSTVAERVAFWQALAEDQGRLMRVAVPHHPLPVPLAQDDLTDMVDVLIDNVFDHTPEETPFAVDLRAVNGSGDGRPDGIVLLTVVDDGPGLTAGRRDRRGSTGLGLDIVRRTATGCGGDLSIASGPAGGTRVEVRLPLMRA